MNTKGFIVAVDALLALVILFGIITLAYSSFDRTGSEWAERARLSAFAYHLGTSLETSQYLSRAVLSDSTASIQATLDSIPGNLCSSVSVYASPDANETEFVVSKSGCSTVLGETETVAQGFMVASPPDANLYVAKIGVWVNHE